MVSVDGLIGFRHLHCQHRVLDLNLVDALPTVPRQSATNPQQQQRTPEEDPMQRDGVTVIIDGDPLGQERL